MTTTGRLRVTSVRYADPAELAALGRPAPAAARAAEREIVLVVGQPPLGYAVLRGTGDRLRLTELAVDPAGASIGIEGMLVHAARGVALDAGQGLLDVAQDLLDVGPAAIAAAGFGSIGEPLLDAPEPVPAVSVIPLRDGPAGLESFVQHRVATMDFAAGAVVFPGGRVDPGDAAAGSRLDLPAGLVGEHAARWQHTAYQRLSGPEPAARTLLATGLREVAEETGAVLDPARLIPWDDWITPAGYPRRFDVRFFLYAVTPAEEERFGHTTTEAHDSLWVSFAELVLSTERGDLLLLPPTRTLVDELAALGSVPAALELNPEITAVRHDIAARRPRC